jgi:hypothetical protein
MDPIPIWALYGPHMGFTKSFKIPYVNVLFFLFVLFFLRLFYVPFFCSIFFLHCSLSQKLEATSNMCRPWLWQDMMEDLNLILGSDFDRNILGILNFKFYILKKVPALDLFLI